MHSLTVIRRYTRTNLSKELAKEICERGIYGKVVVVTDKPAALLSVTKKQMARLARRLQRERSSTLNAVKISELTQQIAWMQSLSFSAKEPEELLESSVTFGTADTFTRIPPLCSTVYVTYKFDTLKLHMLTSWMQEGGRVIIYERD
ncbi:MAG TPA: hypothetical protein VJ836_06355 [Candidatus Saccharimonadales bacterium]|nr:hypothetical protein [Candidatus Saccharimonadales bacterium]